MDVEVEPGTVFVTIWRSVEEDDLAFVPALVALAYVGQVETGHSVGRVGADPRHAALVSLSAVGWVRLVPYVYRYLLPLTPTPTRHINEVPLGRRHSSRRTVLRRLLALFRGPNFLRFFTSIFPFTNFAFERKFRAKGAADMDQLRRLECRLNLSLYTSI